MAEKLIISEPYPPIIYIGMCNAKLSLTVDPAARAWLKSTINWAINDILNRTGPDGKEPLIYEVTLPNGQIQATINPFLYAPTPPQP